MNKTEDKMPSSNTTMRTECPVGYEPVDLNDSGDCPAIEDVLSESKSSSLWLIKLPHDFNVSSLSGQNVILNGSQDLLYINDKNKDKRYEILSKENSSAELSSFSVVLPSSRKKLLRAASALHGQMSVIQSVSVPPPTLPDASDSLTVQRQTHSEHIKKRTPFGYRRPQRKLKEKRTKELSDHLGDGTPGGRKKTTDKKTSNLERTAMVESEVKEKSKRDSPKKKKKDKERQEIDLSRVKTEPGLDNARKRKGDEKYESAEEGNGFTSAKQKREKKRKSLVGNVTVKREGVGGVNEIDNGFDLAPVKSEPRETLKKVKKQKKHNADKHEKKEKERTSHSSPYYGVV